MIQRQHQACGGCDHRSSGESWSCQPGPCAGWSGHGVTSAGARQWGRACMNRHILALDDPLVAQAVGQAWLVAAGQDERHKRSVATISCLRDACRRCTSGIPLVWGRRQRASRVCSRSRNKGAYIGLSPGSRQVVWNCQRFSRKRRLHAQESEAERVLLRAGSARIVRLNNTGEFRWHRRLISMSPPGCWLAS